MELYSFDEQLDRRLGKIGTPERDAFEKEVADGFHAYQIGEAIKLARKQKKLTQEQLGIKVGVQKTQISKVENGKLMSLPLLSRLLRALDIRASLDLVGFGKVALA